MWDDASRLGQGAPSSFRISAPVPPVPGPGAGSGAAGSSQEGSRQPAPLGGCSQAPFCAKALLMVLTSNFQEASPPTQSQLQLFLCETQLRPCTTTYLTDLIIFFPVCIGDVLVWGHVSVWRRGGDPRPALGVFSVWGHPEQPQSCSPVVSHFLTLTYEVQLSKAQTAANGSDAGWQKD